MLRSFLARFTLVTFLAAVITAVGLAYVLDREHEKVLESDLMTTSVGQTSALLAGPLSRVDPRTKNLNGPYSDIAKGAAEVSSFQEYVRGVRVYWPNGTALFPSDGLPDPQRVAAAIAAQDVVRGSERISKNERLMTGFVPIASRSSSLYSAVIAIDFSLAQMRAQDAPEQRVVIGATLGAVLLSSFTSHPSRSRATRAQPQATARRRHICPNHYGHCADRG